jgi:hypothetical protein
MKRQSCFNVIFFLLLIGMIILPSLSGAQPFDLDLGYFLNQISYTIKTPHSKNGGKHLTSMLRGG